MRTKLVKGISDREFDALVDVGFDPDEAKPRGKGGMKPWVPPDEVIDALEAEGADPRLSRGAARLHGVLGRCFKSTHGPLSQESVDFLNKFDAAGRELAKANGIKLRD